MLTRRTLLPLAALLAVCFVGSGLLKHDSTGVLSTAAWIGFVLLTLFFLVVAIVTIVRNRRRLGAGRAS